MSIELDTLKTERDKLKAGLRELETEQRQADAVIKKLRQREIRNKRELDALETLLEMQEKEGDEKPKDATATKEAPAPASTPAAH